MQMAITSSDFRLRQDTIDLIERRMRFALTRFTTAIDDVTVMISDVNGPKKGALDKKCRVVVRLHPKGSLVVNQLAGDVASAASIAAERIGRVVGRYLERRRDVRRSRSRRRHGLHPEEDFIADRFDDDEDSLNPHSEQAVSDTAAHFEEERR